MNWYQIGIVIYGIVLSAVIIRIVYETNNSSKALAYVFFCLVAPVVGVVFYLVFGINYFHKRRYNKKTVENAALLDTLNTHVAQYTATAVTADSMSVAQNEELSYLLLKDIGSPLTAHNEVMVLANGENKFPEFLQAIAQATHHIHLEYYIYECDNIGMQIIEALIAKAKTGVEVRFIYDDFGSPSIKKALEKRMVEAGIEIRPFYKINFHLLANRYNYRNHRKILIVDGCTAFVGGINVSDKYVNDLTHCEKKKLYWRDTHLKINGPGVYYLQYLFITDWSFCCSDDLKLSAAYFPLMQNDAKNCYVQIAAGGPDSPMPSILYSLMQAINLAKKEILITTPYFIPGDSMLDAICMAAMSGVAVKLLVPAISDSKIVGAASKSYYTKLLEAGAEIYMYRKGFVHAKTMVTDSQLCIVGTANMDVRSFELNFEVNCIVYNKAVAAELRTLFYEDLKEADMIAKEQWLGRSWAAKLPERFARLFSPVL